MKLSSGIPLSEPYLVHQGHRSIDKYGRKRGVWIVEVYSNPVDPNKYSFAYTDGGAICRFEEFEETAYLSGCFDTPEGALEAGLEFGVEERRRMRGR